MFSRRSTSVTASNDDDDAPERDAGDMRVRVKPRLQQEKWSLYWKTSMATRTFALDEFDMEVEHDKTTAKQVRERQRRWWSVGLTRCIDESESDVADWTASGVVVASFGGVCRTLGIDVRFGDATRRDAREKRSLVSRRGD